MSNIFPILAPGIASPRSTQARIVFRQRGERYLAQGMTIDGTKSRDPGNSDDVGVLRPGLLLGKLTSNGRLAPSILGVTTNAEAVGSTAIEALAPVITELVRRVGASGTFKLIGPAAANGPIQSETVTYSSAATTIIVVTAIVNAYVAGSFIQVIDGSEFPLTFTDDLSYGIQVTDNNGTSVSAVDAPRVPIDGVIESSQLLPVWPSDTSLQNWLVANLNGGGGGQYNFSHRLGV